MKSVEKDHPDDPSFHVSNEHIEYTVCSKINDLFMSMK